MGTNLSISPQRFVILHLRQSKFKSMGKGTNFSGQPVFSQLIKLYPHMAAEEVLV